MNPELQSALIAALTALATWAGTRTRERHKAREYVAKNPRRGDDRRLVHVEDAVKKLDTRVYRLEQGNEAINRELKDTRMDVNQLAENISDLRTEIATHTGKVDEALVWIKAGLQERKA